MKQHFANEQLVARVQTSTGLTKREAQVAVIATTVAIIDQLLDGKEVNMRGLGTLCFFVAKARKVPQRPAPNGRMLPALTLTDRPVLKFEVANSLRQQLKGVEPLIMRKRQPWSDKRKPKVTPIPSPTQGDAASPNNPDQGDGAA